MSIYNFLLIRFDLNTIDPFDSENNHTYMLHVYSFLDIFPNYIVNITSTLIWFWTFFPAYTLLELHAY